MTLSREPNTYNSGNLREYLRLWLGNQTHIYGQSKYPSIQYMYTCDSLRFFNSIHNTQVNLSVTYRRSPFTPFAFLPFAYLQRRTSLLLRVLREVHHYYFRGFPAKSLLAYISKV